MRANAGDGSRQGDILVTLTQRLNPDPRHTPDNVIPFARVERRAKPRWMQRMEEQGLPVQDSTSRVLGAYVPTGSDAAS
jgi:hypothetical protein